MYIKIKSSIQSFTPNLKDLKEESVHFSSLYRYTKGSSLILIVVFKRRKFDLPQ